MQSVPITRRAPSPRTFPSSRWFASSTSSRTADSGPLTPMVQRQRMKAYPITNRRSVPASIPRPHYAATGIVQMSPTHDTILLHDQASIGRMRAAAQLARDALDIACAMVHQVTDDGRLLTTDEIDAVVHDYIISKGAYPSPLNYAGFPKSLCSSINEIICHGIPDTRILQMGDVVSFDVRSVRVPADCPSRLHDSCTGNGSWTGNSNLVMPVLTLYFFVTTVAS